jgi:hypothetical protein
MKQLNNIFLVGKSCELEWTKMKKYYKEKSSQFNANNNWINADAVDLKLIKKRRKAKNI